jgi:hypothetical protein
MIIRFNYLYLQQKGMHKIKIQSRLQPQLCKGQKVRGKSLRHDVEFHVPTNIIEHFIQFCHNRSI